MKKVICINNKDNEHYLESKKLYDVEYEVRCECDTEMYILKNVKFLNTDGITTCSCGKIITMNKPLFLKARFVDLRKLRKEKIKRLKNG